MRGRAYGDGAVTGNVFGFDSESLTVVCRNMDTGLGVPFQLAGETSWDCEVQGLVVTPGDFIDIVIRGNAQ